MRIVLLFLIGLSFSISSCERSKLQDVINQAGENGEELQIVLDHYSVNISDSLKYKAAVFLIENMPYHYGVDQDVYCKGQQDSLFKWSDHVLNHKFGQDNEQLKIYGQVVDSLQLRIVKGKPNWDRDVITASFLINNIEYAFKAWQMPWCKHLGFEEFCEYILPYRCQTEPLTHWRQYFYEKYEWIKDSLPENSTPLEACVFMQNTLKKKTFWSDRYVGFYSGFLPPKLFEKIKVGACENLANYTSLVMRAVGIPVLYDQILYWEGQKKGHVYNWLITSDSVGGAKFGVTDSPPHTEKLLKATKVMRTTYKLQNNPLWKEWMNGDYVPPCFVSSHITDVTDKYCFTNMLKIRSSDVDKIGEIIWLCTITANQLKAVNYSVVDDKETLYFPKTTKDLVYILAKHNNGELIPISDPFINKGEFVEYYSPRMDSLTNFKFEREFQVKQGDIKRIRNFQMAYWHKGWNNITAIGHLIENSCEKRKNGKTYAIYSIELTKVPKEAYYMIPESWVKFFIIDNNGKYQKR